MERQVPPPAEKSETKKVSKKKENQIQGKRDGDIGEPPLISPIK
jgi:hypothetical protein